MKKHIMRFLNRKPLRGCLKYIAAATLILSAATAYPQAKFWGFNYSNSLNFTPVASLGTPMPHNLIPGVGVDERSTNANSVFDQSGNVLFSVTGKGVFDGSGSLIAGFSWLGGGFVSSEIEIFPNGSACGHYYVLFTAAMGSVHGPLYLLDVDASNPAAVSVVFNVLNDNIGTAIYKNATLYPYTDKDGTQTGIVATASDVNGNRKVYVNCMTYDWVGGKQTNFRYVLKNWQFNADGSYTELPEIPLDYGPLPFPGENSTPGDQMNRVTIMEATPDGSRVAYAGPYSLKVVNTSTGTVTTYPINDLLYGAHMGINAVTGIEWMPLLQRWYVSYIYLAPGSAKVQSTIKFFYEGVTGPINSLGGAMHPSFGGSELELGKDNKMYFAACPSCANTSYNNYEIGIGLASPYNTAYYTPGQLYCFDPVTVLAPPVYNFVPGIAVTQSTHNSFWYYLNNQIDGEDYSTWWTAGNITNSDINNGASMPYTLSCTGTSYWGPLQIIDKSDNLILRFKNAAGASINPGTGEEYQISWVETNACGDSVVSFPTLNYTDTWHSGKGPIDLKTYGGGLLASPAAYFKYFGVTIVIRNKCTGAMTQSRALIQIGNIDAPCSDDFIYRIYPDSLFSLQLLPIAPTPNSVYKAMWDASAIPSTYSNINVTHWYSTPGTYRVCVGEFRFGDRHCATCVNLCVPHFVSPGTGCRVPFYLDGYSNSPNTYTIHPITPIAGHSYEVNWGDGALVFGSTTPAHIYSTPGTYSICFRERNSSGAIVCTTCLDICIPSTFSKVASADATKDAAAATDQILVYPNPAQEEATLQITLEETAPVQVTLNDMTGKTVTDVFGGTLNSGTHQLRIATGNLAAGLYLIQVKNGNQLSTHKLSVVR